MKFIDPGFKGNNPGHYSTAVVSNGMLYVSGLLSMDPDTREVCTGDIQAHAAQALQNLVSSAVKWFSAASIPRPTNTGAPLTLYMPSFLANTNPAGLSFRQLRFTSAASLKSNALPNSKPMTDSN